MKKTPHQQSFCRPSIGMQDLIRMSVAEAGNLSGDASTKNRRITKSPASPPFDMQASKLHLLQSGEVAQVVASALVAEGVLVKVELVVLLGVPPLASLHDLGGDLAIVPLLVDLGGDLLSNALLLGVVVEDARAVLGAGVVALTVESGRVVHAVEELEQLLVAESVGIVDQLGGLRICN